VPTAQKVAVIYHSAAGTVREAGRERRPRRMARPGLPAADFVDVKRGAEAAQTRLNRSPAAGLTDLIN